MLVVGVDGCPDGWSAIAVDDVEATLRPQVHPSFANLIASHEVAACIAVDVPIGLSESPRACDVEARRMLGRPRGSSVFRPPSRAAFGITSPGLNGWIVPDHRTASMLNRHSCGEVGLSIQSHAIMAKIAEVDVAIIHDVQQRIIEVHPEVSFWALAGRSMINKKRSARGYDERRSFLDKAFNGIAIPSREEARYVAPPAEPDDVLDAIVAAWTARRFAQGIAGILPEEPSVDARGLLMQIVY